MLGIPTPRMVSQPGPAPNEAGAAAGPRRAAEAGQRRRVASRASMVAVEVGSATGLKWVVGVGGVVILCVSATSRFLYGQKRLLLCEYQKRRNFLWEVSGGVGWV